MSSRGCDGLQESAELVVLTEATHALDVHLANCAANRSTNAIAYIVVR